MSTTAAAEPAPDPLTLLAVTCPHLARNLGLLPPEQLQTILTTEKSDK